MTGSDSLHPWMYCGAQVTSYSFNLVRPNACLQTDVQIETAERSVNRVFMQVRHFLAGGHWQKPWPMQVVRLAKRCKDAARLERAWSAAGRQN